MVTAIKSTDSHSQNPFPAERFVTLRDVPVFVEHETIAKDGRRLRFGRAELEAVCRRCNQRIDQTGDYAAVTLGHTPAGWARWETNGPSWPTCTSTGRT